MLQLQEICHSRDSCPEKSTNIKAKEAGQSFPQTNKAAIEHGLSQTGILNLKESSIYGEWIVVKRGTRRPKKQRKISPKEEGIKQGRAYQGTDWGKSKQEISNLKEKSTGSSSKQNSMGSKFDILGNLAEILRLTHRRLNRLRYRFLGFPSKRRRLEMGF